MKKTAVTAVCASCGKTFVRESQPGRPRKFCEVCLPSLGEIGQAAYSRARRAAVRREQDEMRREWGPLLELLEGRR